jgi:folate-binding protein YgfZ
VSGPDALAFLHRLLANDVRSLRPGQGNRSLLLSSKGKVRFDVDVALEEQRALLSLAGDSEALRQALETYHFTEKLEVTDVSAEHAPLAVCGPRAREVLAKAFGGLPELADHESTTLHLGRAPITVTALPVAGSPGWRVDGGPRLALELWNALREAGATPAGRIVHDILRVEAGWAEHGVDVDDGVYPQEARIERAFSLAKGCYVGQEVVAKIDTYGGLNKRLVALRVSHDDPVERGTRLWREDEGEWRDLGLVTSWAYSFVLDTGLVLAYVKRRHQKPGTRFRLGDANAPSGEATIVPLPVRSNALAPTGEFE